MYFSRYHITAKVQKHCISNVTYFLYYAICSHLIEIPTVECTYYKFFLFLLLFTFL